MHTQLWVQVSSCHYKYLHIIENRQRGTPCTWYRSFPITKMTRLKEHVGPPCVVLVIDDNLYGLMCVLSYTCRICPLTSLGACVGFKVKEMRRRFVGQAQYARSMMRN